jgi:hypothetical protein
MKYESTDDLSTLQILELSERIAEAMKVKDAFTTEADVFYFETNDYLAELTINKDTINIKN